LHAIETGTHILQRHGNTFYGDRGTHFHRDNIL
jgi:hypothetical protein